MSVNLDSPIALPKSEETDKIGPVPRAIEVRCSRPKLVCVEAPPVDLTTTTSTSSPSEAKWSITATLPDHFGDKVVFRRGGDEDSPVIVQAQRNGSCYDIFFPLSQQTCLLPSRLRPLMMLGVGLWPCLVSRSVKQWFDFLSKPNGVVERFEWHPSKKIELRAMWSKGIGRKLVRIPETSNPLSRIIGLRSGRLHGKYRSSGASSHGREIVAVWSTSGNGEQSIGRLEFMGSGADGELGEQWAILTLMSAIRAWNQFGDDFFIHCVPHGAVAVGIP